MCELNRIKFESSINNVQDLWNMMEEKLAHLRDTMAPMKIFSSNQTSESQKVAPHIKRKLNTRRRLIAKLKQTPSQALKVRVKNLNIAIKNHFDELKRKSVRQNLVPGNSRSLWRAVSAAKNTNVEEIPDQMLLNGAKVKTEELWAEIVETTLVVSRFHF